MKQKITLLMLPLLAVLFSVCSPDPVDTTGSISGTIRDALDNSVLQGASVTLSPSGKTTVTGNDGHYQFLDVEFGDYTVSVTKADYESTSQKASIQVGQNTTLDFTLRRAKSDLEVSPLILDFGETDTNLPLVIKNVGQATMTWELVKDEPWVSCTPQNGSILAGQEASATITIDRTGLTGGTYNRTLIVNSNNGGSVTVRLTMIVKSNNPNLSTVSMIDVTGITDVAASFSGQILDIGNSRVTAHGFCWGTLENPSLENGNSINLGTTDNPKEFSYSVPNLNPNQHYFVRAYAKNSAGIVYSSKQLDFTTLSVQGKATVETGAASQVTSRGATVAGTATDLGCAEGVTQHGHVWSDVSAQPTVDYAKTELGELKQTGSFTSSLINLKPNTLYYVRAYARNKYGINYGEVIQVTTLKDEVKLQTSSVTDIIHNEATCGGRITDYGGNTVRERGICWNTSANPTLAYNSAVSTDNSEAFSTRLTNLTAKTTYHVRAYAKTDEGDTYYGQDVQFQTTQVITLPELSIVSVSNVTYKKATFTAKVTSLGNGTIKRSGFCYATSPNPTIKNTLLSCGTASDMQATATSLSAETTYYVRPFAENEKGVNYGEEQTFTTKEKPETGDINREDWGNDENWN